jgi:hypothetical protein
MDMDLGADRSSPAAGDEPAVDAREAFALLGHEIRLDILLALFEDWMAAYTEPKSYAELMDAVEMEDSGKFNYHLGKLRGVYVRQVEDGYVPTASATALYRAVLATRPTETVESEHTLAEANCPSCGARPTLRYERGFVTADCPDCAAWDGFTYPFPQNGFEQREPEALLPAVHQRVRHEVGLARAGQCPSCAGPIAVDPRVDAIDDSDHWVELACKSCTFVVGIDLLSVLLTDDRVAAAVREIGLDPQGYDWDQPDGTRTICSRDPLRLSLTVGGPSGVATVETTDTLAIERVTVE